MEHPDLEVQLSERNWLRPLPSRPSGPQRSRRFSLPFLDVEGQCPPGAPSFRQSASRKRARRILAARFLHGPSRLQPWRSQRPGGVSWVPCKLLRPAARRGEAPG